MTRANWLKPRSRLFAKYFVSVAALTLLTLIASSGLGAWFAYKDTEAQLIALHHEIASAAATRIELYIKDIEHQIGWSALGQPGANEDVIERQRLDYFKLLRQVHAITSITWIDKTGREQLHISRLGEDVAHSNVDFSGDRRFTAAIAGTTDFSPVYFLKKTEPYMSISRPAGGGGGVTIAEVNLKFVWDVISQIQVGKAGLAYVVDSNNLLIAHPDISQVLRRADLSNLAQVATRPGTPVSASETLQIARDMSGRQVVTSQAPIPSLNWRVFVELPVDEAFAPIYSLLERAALLLLIGLIVSLAAGVLLTRQMVRPIRLLQDGAARIGAGNLDQRIEIHSGDELEALADQFNTMAAQLSESYAGLERKVEERTAQLAGEQEKSRTLLHNILPEQVIQQLAKTGRVIPARHEKTTVLFTDFAGFTQATSTMPADRMVEELNEIFAAFDDIAHEVGVEKIKTIGDAYMAVAGLFDDTLDHAPRCVDAALRMIAFMEQRNADAAFKWNLRVGIHSGPVVSGVVGKRKYAFDIWGDAVNIASRMESSGEAGRVNVSAYTYDLIRTQFKCSYRGKITAKGKGDIDMYFVDGPIPVPLL